MPDTLQFFPAVLEGQAVAVPTGGEGTWSRFASGPIALTRIANELVVPRTNTRAEQFKSIPTPWARALLFEQALFSVGTDDPEAEQVHPVRDQIVAEWRGLLGALALGDYLGASIRGLGVDLGDAPPPTSVAATLRSLAPAGESDAWQKLTLIYIGQKPNVPGGAALGESLVGGTSPRTLVFSGIRGAVPSIIPFQRSGRFVDPTAYYAEHGEATALGLLATWITQLHRDLREPASKAALDAFLGHVQSGPNSEPLSRAAALINELGRWRDDTQRALATLGAPALNVESYGAPAIAPHSAGAAQVVFQLIRPLRSTVVDQSDFQILGSSAEMSRIVDPGRHGAIVKDGVPYTGKVRLPGGQVREVVNGRFEHPVSAAVLGDPNAPDFGAMMQSRLLEAVDVAAERARALRINPASAEADARFVLYPFGRDALAILSEGEIAQWSRVAGDPATSLTGVFEVPIQSGLAIRYQRTYTPADILEATTPDLAVWPDFETAAPAAGTETSWRHHFYFLRRKSIGESLVLSPVTAQPDHPSHEDGGTTWGRTETPIRAWEGTVQDANGLLLVAPAPTQTLNTSWTVSVDFGSTHTRVFRQSGQSTEPVTLTSQTVPLLGKPNDLNDVFFPATFGEDMSRESREELLSLVWFPMLRPSRRTDDWLPCDGVMYLKESLDIPVSSGLRSNIKWFDSDEDSAAFKSYLTHLLLSVAARAGKAGAHIETVRYAYPSVFPSHRVSDFEAEWEVIHRSLGGTLDAPQSESVALAAYLKSDEQVPTQALVACDVGGSTSDVAVWLGQTLVYNDSVRLAGDVLARLVNTKPEAREALWQAVRKAPFQFTDNPFDDASEGQFALGFNQLLRKISRERGDTLQLAKNLFGGPTSPGAFLIAHAGYLFATLGFVMGLMARKAGPEAPHYELRFGGRASSFLPWLDQFGRGASREIPEAFFRAALAATRADGDAEVQVVEVGHTRPGFVKHEVGRGLLASTILTTEPAYDRTTFAGENGLMPGHPNWSDDVSVRSLRGSEAPGAVDADSLTLLHAFVDAFDATPTTQRVAESLGVRPGMLDYSMLNALSDTVGTMWQHVNGEHPDPMLEPLIVAEARELLMRATENPTMFNDLDG